ncbi:Ig-like domain-containing protein [Clostridium kluyveri]|uniref:Ig-like domain-containing protein n=1 Tax=Clostridium kluyveri TaxID=1534 RepID=UPI0009F87815|nr:Ig-like domain-containing protein [Clostridium kluyveri]
MIKRMKKYSLIALTLFMFLCLSKGAVLAEDSDTVNLGTRTITDVNKTWTITFNNPIEFDSVAGNVEIRDVTTGNNVPISPVQGDNRSVVIVKAPSEGYTVGHNYLITVNKNIKLESGTPLSKTTTLNFIVASKEDNEYTLSADITVSPIISVFKQITVTSTNLPGASKYKIDENNKLFDIGETMASLISEDTVKVYICDSSGNVLGTADMDVSTTKNNISLKLQ